MKLFKRIVCNILIVSYLAIIYFSGVPESNTLNSRLKQKAESFAFMIGIWPSWSMFAPNPIKFDSKSFVEITYRNGEIRTEDVEEKLSGVLAPFRKARWMKYSQDNLRNPNQSVLLNPALRHFYWKYNDPQNPIVSMHIKRQWTDVPAFNNKNLKSIFDKSPKIQGTEILLTEYFKE